MNDVKPGLMLALEFVDSKLKYLNNFTKSVDCDTRMLARLETASQTLNQLRGQIVRAIGPE